ncbi:hypothetical protein GN156_00240 [bacterium LRH843]|nr:hypothetical protein [bacterium LRH843]
MQIVHITFEVIHDAFFELLPPEEISITTITSMVSAAITSPMSTVSATITSTASEVASTIYNCFYSTNNNFFDIDYPPTSSTILGHQHPLLPVPIL